MVNSKDNISDDLQKEVDNALLNAKEKAGIVARERLEAMVIKVKAEIAGGRVMTEEEWQEIDKKAEQYLKIIGSTSNFQDYLNQWLKSKENLGIANFNTNDSSLLFGKTNSNFDRII